MLKSRLSALVTILLGALLIALLAKGFGIANIWSFGGERTTETSAGPRVTVWIDTHIQYSGLLGVNIYGRSRAPASLRLEFNAPKNSCRAVDLHAVTLRYSDGRTKQIIGPIDNLQRLLEDQYINWAGEGLVTNRASRLVYTFTNVMDRIRAVTITCKGDFIKADGSST